MGPARLSHWLHSRKGSLVASGRRTKGEGSIYQRSSDDRWVGVVDMGWVGGKRVRKTTTAATLRELRPKMKALKDRVAGGIVDDRATVEQWMTYWLDKVVEVRPRTLATYRGYSRTWIVPMLGKRELTKVRPEHIRAVYEAMRDKGRADATVRQVHAILLKAFADAVNDSRLLSNPVARVKAPRVGEGHHGALSAEDAHKVLQAARNTDELCRLGVALLMGLRQSEALGLRWENVRHDGVGWVAVIDQSAQRVAGKGVVVGSLKSAAAYRSVPIVPELGRALEALREQTGGTGFVFGGERPRDPRRDWQVWRDAQTRAGVGPTPLHGARASTASVLVARGVPERVIADILGHRNVAVTQAHYIRSDEAQRRDAVGLLGDAIVLPALPAAP